MKSSYRIEKQDAIRMAKRSVLFGMSVNGFLALLKGFAGFYGNSQALIADAVESFVDIISSVVVWTGLKIALAPSSEKYPYGRGRVDAISGVIAAGTLFLAALFIATESIHQIRIPHASPAPYTLGVLVIALLLKESLSRYILRSDSNSHSSAMKGEAFHHRSDAITSLMAFIGIGVALIGGPGYESADDWAALFAAGIIIVNGFFLLLPALGELMDRAPDSGIGKQIRIIALSVEGVMGTHKCHVRKLGFDYYVELDILCNPNASIRYGHTVSHNVGKALHEALPIITRVIIHVEPADDYGRRSQDSRFSHP